MLKFTYPYLLFVVFIMCCLSRPPVFADLVRYVQIEDPVYRWEQKAQSSLGNSLSLYELLLTSQVWQGITWQHTLRIIVPQELQQPPLAFLLITGPAIHGDEVQEGKFLAEQTGAPVAILYDIPNQPLFNGLTEDDLLAYTLVRSIETHDTTWPLLLPMVKGAVRAMDAVQEFFQKQLTFSIPGFVVSGASKRGWTTWLTPLVDERVKAIVPMVYDNLNLFKQMQHQLATWGKFSENISEYTDRSLPQRLLSNEQDAQMLSALIDPFAYRNHLTVPKLIIIGTNDRYWPLDALNLYYDELPEEKYLLYIPNAGHDLGAGKLRALQNMVAFMQKIRGLLSFPRMEWTFQEEEETIRLTITSDLSPRAGRVWIASSATKDFRPAVWESFTMNSTSSPSLTTFRYTLKKPTSGYQALFGEVEYSQGTTPFLLSTQVHIFP